MKSMGEKFIVSMTSWPPRINSVASAFKAVIDQVEEGMNVHFVLTLASEEFPNKEKDLPQDILDLGVEIIWCERNTRSHKKLMPVLKAYPDSPIIVIDDDTRQVDGWLKTFIEDHEKHPEDIIFGQSTSVVHIGIGGQICEVRNGKTYELKGAVAYTQKPASGAAGTLFPPHTFTREEFFDEDLMMGLSPTCDETWQWAFGLMEGRTFRALSGCNIPMPNESNQECSLIHTNKVTINKIHSAIAARFPEYKVELQKRQGLPVVSLYSHDERLSFVHKTIASILRGTIRPSKVILNIPKGQKEMLSEETRQMVECGAVELYEVPLDAKRHSAYLFPLLRYSGCALIVVSDNRVYDEKFAETLYINYLNNPVNVYAGDTKIIALDADNAPMNYEEWGKHGRLYNASEGHRDVLPLMSGGYIIPPSGVVNTFNKGAVLKYIHSADALMKCSLASVGLAVAKCDTPLSVVHSGMMDEDDSAEEVNNMIKEYRVI
jgi:hypothetical protein